MALNNEPLGVDSYGIRMLTTLPGLYESAVKCTMEKTKLISPIRCAALSYCWGYLAIIINIFVNGIKTPVKTRLEDALQHVRKLGVSRIWADA
jgi:Heterokaryon incompatibility protein (HET)